MQKCSSLIDSHVPSYNKPNFPNAVPQKACRPKFQPPTSVLKSEDSKDEGQDSGINVEPTSKEGLRKFLLHCPHCYTLKNCTLLNLSLLFFLYFKLLCTNYSRLEHCMLKLSITIKLLNFCDDTSCFFFPCSRNTESLRIASP